jgi:malate/lactate dehydrogenase
MKISIIGASGTLGSCTAFNIITHRLTDEMVLLDVNAGLLNAHWMDLNIAVTGMDIAVSKGDWKDIKGSDIVINAAGAPSGVITSRSALLPSNFPIIKEAMENVNKYCPDAIVITQTNPVDGLNYAVYLLSQQRDRRKCIGYALNDTIRFRMWAAQFLGVNSSQVDGFAIGEHGESQVMLFSTLRVDGKPANVDEDTKNKILAQPPIFLHDFETNIPKRTAGWVSAVGTTAIVRAIKTNSREVIPSGTVLNGEYGYHDLSMTVPAVIGKDGIEDIKMLDLSSEEKEKLNNSVKAITPQMGFVEQQLGIKK